MSLNDEHTKCMSGSGHPSTPQEMANKSQDSWAKAAVNQLKALQNAVSVPLFSVVQTFDGSPKQFKDFIKRYLEEKETMCKDPSWQELKIILQKRFGEIVDEHQAMTTLRNTKQDPNESVKVFSLRMLE